MAILLVECRNIDKHTLLIHANVESKKVHQKGFLKPERAWISGPVWSPSQPLVESVPGSTGQSDLRKYLNL